MRKKASIKKTKATNDEASKRGSGLLLHVTSLPSPYGIGDMGEAAYRFVNFLAESKQNFWQILPLNPTAPVLGNSPYSSVSAFAGNNILINPDFLVKDDYLAQSDIEGHPHFPDEKVDYQAVTDFKNKILHHAFQKYHAKLDKDKDFGNFCKENSYWLDDFALFIALKENFNGAVWNTWPLELRDRKPGALKEWAAKLSERILKEKFIQFLFFKQWVSLKSYCNGKKIKIIGDIPIYVSHDSADVWVNPQIFKLDKNKNPAFVAGVPPDYFSSTGQLWGNPVYRWDVLARNGFDWWLKRFEHNLKLFDIIRLDHFRGFVGFWEVAASEPTAVKGKWVKVPAKEFFTKVALRFPHLPIIAEDLGTITDDVKSIMRQFKLPGMKLLLFAFDDNPAKNPYIPHNQVQNCVVYTGTHDNNTTRGWFEKDARDEDRNRVLRYFGRQIPSDAIAWEFSKLAMMSVADTVILPMQDILGLGAEARMNRPSTVGDNWQWRVSPHMINPSLAGALREITETYGRV